MGMRKRRLTIEHQLKKKPNIVFLEITNEIVTEDHPNFYTNHFTRFTGVTPVKASLVKWDAPTKDTGRSSTSLPGTEKRTNPVETTTQEGLKGPRRMGLCVVVRVCFLILPLKELYKVVKSCRDPVFRFFPSCFRFRGWFEWIFVCTHTGFVMCHHGFTVVT